MKAKEILIILLLISALAFTEWNRLKINRLEARVDLQQELLNAHQKLLVEHQKWIGSLNDLTGKTVNTLIGIVEILKGEDLNLKQSTLEE